jgi:hypothetical protein
MQRVEDSERIRAHRRRTGWSQLRPPGAVEVERPEIRVLVPIGTVIELVSASEHQRARCRVVGRCHRAISRARTCTGDRDPRDLFAERAKLPGIVCTESRVHPLMGGVDKSGHAPPQDGCECAATRQAPRWSRAEREVPLVRPIVRDDAGLVRLCEHGTECRGIRCHRGPARVVRGHRLGQVESRDYGIE